MSIFGEDILGYLTVEVRYFTDPACPWSWGFEPRFRCLLSEFEGQLDVRLVMGGLARRFGDAYEDDSAAITARAAAAIAAGAERVNGGNLDPLDAIARFGRCATREVEVLSGRPAPVVESELWAAAHASDLADLLRRRADERDDLLRRLLR